MGLKSGEIDNLLIRQLKQTANKPVTRLVLLTGFNTPPSPSQEGSQLQPVTKLIAQNFLNWHIGILPYWLIIFYINPLSFPHQTIIIPRLRMYLPYTRSIQHLSETAGRSIAEFSFGTFRYDIQ